MFLVPSGQASLTQAASSYISQFRCSTAESEQTSRLCFRLFRLILHECVKVLKRTSFVVRNIRHELLVYVMDVQYHH